MSDDEIDYTWGLLKWRPPPRKKVKFKVMRNCDVPITEHTKQARAEAKRLNMERRKRTAADPNAVLASARVVEGQLTKETGIPAVKGKHKSKRVALCDLVRRHRLLAGQDTIADWWLTKLIDARVGPAMNWPEEVDRRWLHQNFLEEGGNACTYIEFRRQLRTVLPPGTPWVRNPQVLPTLAHCRAHVDPNRVWAITKPRLDPEIAALAKG